MMIATLTLNPSIDYIIQVPDFKEGEINRTVKEQILPGGKGINVSIVLDNLGYRNTAYGFAGGFTGEEIIRLLQERGISERFIRVKGDSRINVKMKHEVETEINGLGPEISNEDIAALFVQLDELKVGDFLIISGNIPKCLPSDIYEQIMIRYADKGIQIIVDAQKELLLGTLKHHPFLIKPNNHELSAIFNTRLKSKEEVIPYALKLKQAGARNVLVSLAAKGAVLVAENDEVYQVPAPSGVLVNSVGAGDSLVAGFLAGYLESGGDYEYALQLGVAAGSASVFSNQLASREEVFSLLDKVKRIQETE